MKLQGTSRLSTLLLCAFFIIPAEEAVSSCHFEVIAEKSCFVIS